MESSFVLLTTFAYATEAHSLLKKLDDDGIAYKLINESAVPFTHILSNTTNRLEVHVSNEDLPDALQLLNELSLEKEVAAQAMGAGFERISVFCPECDSNEVYRKTGGFSWWKREHRCQECGHTWKQ